MEDVAIALNCGKILLREKDGSNSSIKSFQALKLYVYYLGLTEDENAMLFDVPLYASKTLINGICSTPSQNIDFLQKLDGCKLLGGILKQELPSTVIYQIVRALHFLCATVPSVISVLVERENVIIHLVETLAWTIRCVEPLPFPEGKERNLLATEILKTFFAIGTNSPQYLKVENTASSGKELHVAMTQLGLLLIDVLRLDNTNKKNYNVKLQVINLLMYMPDSYSRFLLQNNGILDLVDLLKIQSDQVIIEKTHISDPNEKQNLIVPILSVLNALATNDMEVKDLIKEVMFPKATDDINKEQGLNVNLEPTKEQIAPMDSPKYTLRYNVIKLMTSIDSNVKRFANEFLWTLCDGNPGEFTNRTGFGNACHFLGIKGLVQLPKN